MKIRVHPALKEIVLKTLTALTLVTHRDVPCQHFPFNTDQPMWPWIL